MARAVCAGDPESSHRSVNSLSGGGKFIVNRVGEDSSEYDLAAAFHASRRSRAASLILSWATTHGLSFVIDKKQNGLTGRCIFSIAMGADHLAQ
jgi:hypothetical protein